MSHCQPLVVLEDVREAGTVPLCQRAARAPGAQQGGIKLLTEPNLETRRGKSGRKVKQLVSFNNERKKTS